MFDLPVSGGVFRRIIGDAREGRLTVLTMDPEAFARVEFECRRFAGVIDEVCQAMTTLANDPSWSIGDGDRSKLTSARVVAKRFSGKAQSADGHNDFHSVLEHHRRIVEDIRVLHETIRERYATSDDEWAARFRYQLSRLTTQRS